MKTSYFKADFKLYFKICSIIGVMLVILVLLIACEPEDLPPLPEEEITESKLTREQVLEQFPDDLDAAWQELEIVS